MSIPLQMVLVTIFHGFLIWVNYALTRWQWPHPHAVPRCVRIVDTIHTLVQLAILFWVLSSLIP